MTVRKRDKVGVWEAKSESMRVEPNPELNRANRRWVFQNLKPKPDPLIASPTSVQAVKRERRKGVDLLMLAVNEAEVASDFKGLLRWSIVAVV